MSLAIAGWQRACIVAATCIVVAGCERRSERPREQAPAVEHAPVPVPAPAPAPPVAPPMEMPVPLWDKGQTTREVDAASGALHGHVVIDLGEPWVPYLFTDGEREDGQPLPNAYRPTYLALARGEFPNDHHGARAEDDKYLELYGILPTLRLLRERFHATEKRACAKELDLGPLLAYEGLVTYVNNDVAKKLSADFRYVHSVVAALMRKQSVDAPEQLDVEQLDHRDRERLQRYLKIAPDYLAVDAVQKRLKCEGYLEGKGRYTHGGLDWATHEALAEFERRHRVYSWGYLGKDTVEVLRLSPMEAERRGVLRVLTERALHAAGIIEDGSTSTGQDDTPRTYRGLDGKQHAIPDLADELEQRIVAAFGLQTPESTLAWLDALGELPDDEHRYVAIEGPPLPEYYDGTMELTLDYDRGDVWYDFPYDSAGSERAQPVQRRPYVTLFVKYLDQKIPIARFGTTIGGWRSDQVDDTVMWRYKESPVGPRVWDEIVASPVWLPPDSTPAKDLLVRSKQRKANEPEYRVNYHETGPSYASAYGLVAAYHHEYFERADGTILIGRDEGIRTHGSVDYMSILRRHSHGCHRLHNHIAVRLMSFVLAHSLHRRLGQQPLAFMKTLVHEDQSYQLELKQGGYVFALEKPIKIEVREGRIRGEVKKPIEFAIPKWNPNYTAYVTPAGAAVEVRGDQLVEVLLPPLIDGGVALELPEVPATASEPTAPATVPSVLGVPRAGLPQPATLGSARVPSSTAGASTSRTLGSTVPSRPSSMRALPRAAAPPR